MIRTAIHAAVTCAIGVAAFAQSNPTLTLPGMEVRTVASGLRNPTTMAFLGPNDFLVLEKNTGRVLRSRNGRMSEVLDLGVNFASERGLLGIALHPRFASDRGVYLFWTCRSATPGSDTAPSEQTCSDANMAAEDTNDILAVPLRGNRVDRFRWDGDKLVYEKNLLMLRSFQADGAPAPPGQNDQAQRPAGNHDGGVLRFGPDGHLYVFFGDQGRRGWLQNLPNGPTPPAPDDQFGGPAPDDAHISGVILRLNPDGTAPQDNPFFRAGAAAGGEAGANLQKVFAYGMRNSFGMAFDPSTGALWTTEHGDDTFDEVNRVDAGMNGGWIQLMGPLSRIGEYRSIEMGRAGGLQQQRWPPERIAGSAQEALSRLMGLPGSFYSDPKFSWRYATFPGALGFAPRTFGRDLAGDLLVSVVGNPASGIGYLIRFNLTPNRRELQLGEAGLEDRVADNNAKFDLTETTPFIVGSGFGIVTDMVTSPRNTIYLISHSRGEIYEIRREGEDDGGLADPTGEDDSDGLGRPLRAQLSGGTSGDQDGSGTAMLRLNSGEGLICYELSVQGIETASGAAIFRGVPGEAVELAMELTAPATGPASGCLPASRELVRGLGANPGDYFISIRNSAFRNGALLGLLSR